MVPIVIVEVFAEVIELGDGVGDVFTGCTEVNLYEQNSDEKFGEIQGVLCFNKWKPSFFL